jgi:transcriptional regulator with GAF, ATPase, and Fis domain
MRLERVLKQSSLLNENRTLRDQISRRNQSDFGEIIGNSPAIAALKKEIGLIAPKAQRVLVTGETGVGKQLVARALHQLSAKRKGPFIDVNCGALPDENLFQSELFGHEQGAFTGATQQRRGRFEQAEGGTLFLDEIGELSANAQTKLLKVIESKTFSRLGGSKTIESDCQLVFATNRDLAQEVKDGNFREDLYYRINVLCLHIPPLRERLDDIPLLASSFLREFCREYNQEPLLLEPSAIKQLQGYGWPGNIRELRNVMERLTIRAQGGSITEEDVRQVGISGQAGGAGVPWQLPDEGIQLEEVERNLVEAALIKADWSQKEAASLLGISADRMNARVKKFGFRHPSWRRHKQ